MRKSLFRGEFPFVTYADFWTCWRIELQRFSAMKMRRGEAFAQIHAQNWILFSSSALDFSI
jgi:hypothetical protein